MPEQERAPTIALRAAGILITLSHISSLRKCTESASERKFTCER
jgi:hypothetical protein